MRPALYRENTTQPWREVEWLGTTARGLIVVREVGRLFPGVAHAALDQIRMPGPFLEFHRVGRKPIRREA